MTAGQTPLQPQDLVLTIFGTYAREPGGTVWSGGVVELLGDFGFSVQAARAALARLVSRELLVRYKSGRLVSYALSSRAEELMAEGDRRIFSFGRGAATSDIWTVVWHAIPDARRIERSRFASRLRFLGFGSLQDATWVAATNREQEAVLLARDLGVEPYTSVLVGRLSRGLPASALVAQAWDLQSVRQSYDAFLGQFERYRRAKERRAADERTAFEVRTLMMHRFRAFPSMDPELPPDLGGDEALRRRVVAVFDEVYSGLAEPAQKHFRAVAQTNL